MTGTIKHTSLGEVITRENDTLASVHVQFCPFITYFPSRKKTWLSKSGVAQPRWVPQTPLGRADCHREHLACSFFKKHWVSIFRLPSFMAPQLTSRMPFFFSSGQKGHLSGAMVSKRMTIAAHRWTQPTVEKQWICFLVHPSQGLLPLQAIRSHV
jgi:hypothetical protein